MKGIKITRENFKIIFNKHYSTLCIYCLKFVRIPAIAEEIVQELFIYLWNKRNELNHIKSIESYLKASVRNRAINYLNRNLHKHLYEELDDTEKSATYLAPDLLLEASQLEKIIEKGIETMPERCYAVFCLKRFEQMPNAKIAEKLNLTIKSVENYTTLSIKHLRKHIKENYPVIFMFILIFI